jgi:hypothetical protein
MAGVMALSLLVALAVRDRRNDPLT